jgi:hypothetical protein
MGSSALGLVCLFAAANKYCHNADFGPCGLFPPAIHPFQGTAGGAMIAFFDPLRPALPLVGEGHAPVVAVLCQALE